nr:MAG TPA: hypothetical protein [Bacteriophage sp.]
MLKAPLFRKCHQNDSIPFTSRYGFCFLTNLKIYMLYY